jgi:D-alanyl-D-alanine carboxypeptidase
MKLNPALALYMIFAASLARADKIDDLVNRAMKSNHIPGLTMAVLKDGKPIKMQAYGSANIEYDVPAKNGTPFLLASMTKSFTATSIMMLVEQGKVNLDAPVSKYLDDTPDAWKAITVRHLLSHTAGLKDRFEETPFDVTKWKINYSLSDMYKSSRATPVDFKPGESFQYSDQGFFLLGMIVEKASGETYPNFLKSHIFDPLEMKNSSTVRLTRIVNGLASGYSQLGGTLYHNSRRTDYGMVSHFGMISTVEDLAKWDAALYGEKLIKRSSIDQMWTPSKLADGSAAYTSYGAYGLGWFVDLFNGHRSVGHGGSTGTAILRFPEDKLTVIVLTTLEQLSGGDAPGIAVEIARQYIPSLSWETLQPKPDPQPSLSATFKASMETIAAGTFEENLYNPFFGAHFKLTIPQQKQALSSLGSLDKVELLESLPWGTGHLARYRTTYKLITVYATVWFDPAGKIAFLEVEPKHKYQ